MGTSPVERGFYGKLPSRGDFLRAGLPRGFVDRWDAWLQICLPKSRARLGSDWALCWLEAPVWRFALAPGFCGPYAVLGLWVPSVDKAGRDFPLTVAAVATDMAWLIPDGPAWLHQADIAACEAVTQAHEPDTLMQALHAATDANLFGDELPDLVCGPPGGRVGGQAGAVWWTAGAPRVAPIQLATSDLPEPAVFASMLHSIGETA